MRVKKSISLRCFAPQMPVQERLSLASSAGYDGVEINFEPTEEFPPDSSDEDLRRLARMLDAEGLSVSAVYNRQQWFNPINSRDVATRDRGRDIIARLIDFAAALRSEMVLVVPGVVDNGIFVDPPEIIPYQHAYETSVSALKELGAYAAASGITLGLENVWNKFLLSPLEFRNFLSEIDSPGVAMYFDTGNVLRTGFPEDWIDILGHWIRAVQVKDFRLAVDNREGFAGLLQGDVDWPAVRASLERIGYDGWITGEVLPSYKFHADRLIYETSAAIDAIFDGY